MNPHIGGITLGVNDVKAGEAVLRRGSWLADPAGAGRVGVVQYQQRLVLARAPPAGCAGRRCWRRCGRQRFSRPHVFLHRPIRRAGRCSVGRCQTRWRQLPSRRNTRSGVDTSATSPIQTAISGKSPQAPGNSRLPPNSQVKETLVSRQVMPLRQSHGRGRSSALQPVSPLHPSMQDARAPDFRGGGHEGLPPRAWPTPP